MKRIQKLVLTIALLGISMALSGQTDQALTPGQPFAGGGGGRTLIVVVSDLHMGADLAWSELNRNLKPLEAFLLQIRSSPNVRELVIAGDLVDEWFVPADINTYDGKDQRDFVRRIALANQGVVDAFNAIIREGNIRVTYVPGNHDLTLSRENIEWLLPGVNQARDEGIGLGTYSPADMPQLAVEHGHRYNFFCAPDMFSNQEVAPGTILPPGYFYTRIAALHVRQHCTANTDAVPVLTPPASGDESQRLLYLYGGVWKWALGVLPIRNPFNEKVIVTGVNGFTGTYSVNDLFPLQPPGGGKISVNLFSGIQDTWAARQARNHVAVPISTEHAILNASSADETDNLAQTQYFLNPASDKRIVVFGHSHRSTIIPTYNDRGTKFLYANAGTWIDRNPAGPTATFVVITPQGNEPSSLTRVALFSFEGESFKELATNTLRL